VAFGEEEGPSVEPFLVGVATLSLLTTAAEENLVLSVSTTRIGWTQRRRCPPLLRPPARGGPVAMSYAARDGAWGNFYPQGLSEMVLTGSTRTTRGRCWRAPRGRAADEVVKRIVAESRGNPLALLELPGELTPGQLSGSSPLRRNSS
jgi:hypothetical protein